MTRLDSKQLDIFTRVAPSEAFDGRTYDPDLDHERLGTQMRAVYDALLTPSFVYPTFVTQWWSLQRLSEYTGYPEASVSARLRDLRKPKFGGHTVERRRVAGGLWEYRLVVGK